MNSNTIIRTRDEGRNHIREMLIDDQVVCWLTAIDYTIRIGTARVRMAGIAGVETKWEHRMKGYMRILFEDTVRYMTGQGYDVSMLFGIPNFYTKFGYAVCLPASRAKVETRDAELAGKVAPPCAIRPFAPGDMPAILDLYSAGNATRSCSLVRLAEYFTAFPKGTWWGRRADAAVVADPTGQAIAYAVWDRSDTEVNVIEVESADERLYPALLHEFAKLAIERRCGHISLFLPPDHSFAEYAQRYGCEWTTEYPRHSGGMMRVLNQGPLFARLLPELQRRATAAGLTDGSMQIKTDLATVTLRMAGGQLSLDESGQSHACAELSQDKLMQWIAGYRSVRDVLNDPAVHADDTARNVLEALFPRGFPCVFHADEF